MKKAFLIVSFFLVSLFANAQYMNIGTKSYPATPVLKFQNVAYGPVTDIFYYTPYLCIGKKSDGSGIVLISVKTAGSVVSKSSCVGGNLIIYLYGTDAIKCVDRRKYSFMNETMQNIYYLTASEMEKLSRYNISSILFSVGWNFAGTASDLKSYTSSPLYSSSSTASYVRNIR